MFSGDWLARDGDIVHFRDPNTPMNTGRFQLIEQPGSDSFLMRSLSSSLILGPHPQSELRLWLERGLISPLSQDDLKLESTLRRRDRSGRLSKTTLRFLSED